MRNRNVPFERDQRGVQRSFEKVDTLRMRSKPAKGARDFEKQEQTPRKAGPLGFVPDPMSFCNEGFMVGVLIIRTVCGAYLSSHIRGTRGYREFVGELSTNRNLS